ncbi:MAG: type III-A CRISPR-associated protein Cas10/Csm1 [Candidatus Muirbacterium halophilum]|nr:type III-A CRISPR-associated protein Cas10/Csm1 [Candidatus Muirbacterium halophilum]MCK9475926.1 type III-A CRISPR-associated protein Cas10/Csm1 [Candidatus Muirbacterium halophilum]
MSKQIDLTSENLRKELVIGALLHDIGKFIQRSENFKKGKHQEKGRDFLKIKNFSEIVYNIAYRHHSNQETSKEEYIDMDSSKSGNLFDWIVCLADNYSSSERSKLKSEKDESINWNSDIPLMSVFSKIQSSEQNIKYLNLDLKENYPSLDTSNNYNIYRSRFTEFEKDLSELKTIDTDNITFLLEKYLSRVPSYTAERKEETESPDISLFDHVKTTSAISEVIYRYIQETGNIPESYNKLETITKKNIFKLIRFDISGIQDFIYTIPTKGALKNLKTRSFYIELISEYINTELLKSLNLSRPCVLYTGGGGGYILSQATDNAEKMINEFFQKLNFWLFEEFSGKLFVAHKTKDFDREVFKPSKDKKESETSNFANLCIELTQELGESKNKKFSKSLDEIFRKREIPKSECKVCNKPLSTAPLKDDEVTKCEQCKRFEDFGSQFTRNHKYLISSKDVKGNETYLEVNGVYYYFSETIKQDSIKNYCVNSEEAKIYSNGNTTSIYIGQLKQISDISELSEFTNNSIGVNGLGVLRMDVDNLGTTFKSGFKPHEQTISRFSALSRSLNIYFKQIIHQIIDDKSQKDNIFFKTPILRKDKTSVMIIYSGGDDLFMIGAWDDVLEYAYRIRDSFKKYTCDNPALTLSAGYTIVSPSFPVHIFSQISEEQEKIAKSNKKGGKEKDSIALWNKAFHWDPLREYCHEILDDFSGFGYSINKNTSLEIKGFGHSIFYSIITQIDKHIDLFDNKENKNKQDFYYIFPQLGYKLGRNYIYNKKTIEKDEYKRKAYEKVTERLASIKGESLEHIVESSEKNLTILRLIEYMHRSKNINKKNGGEKNGISE